MLDKIRQFIYRRREQELQNEITRLKEKINTTIDELGDPKYVIRNILKRDLKFFDYKKLKPEEQEGYVHTGKAVLNNPTYQNEIKHMYVDLVNEIAKESPNFENVMALRMTMNGITLLKERIEELGVDTKPTNKNPHSPI